MTRYSTPKIGFDLPTLDETPDVPRDLRILGDKLDDVIAALRLPGALEYKHQDTHAIPAAAKARLDPASAFGTVLSFTNPHPTWDLVVDVRQRVWSRMTGGHDYTTVIYSEPIVTGGKFVHSMQGRASTANVAGAQKSVSVYESTLSYMVRSLAPGETVSVTLAAWSNRGGDAGSVPDVRYPRLAIIPIGWALPPTSLAHDDDPGEPLPPDVP
jgi:hypothetical protein